jgi:hypothetical protein
MKRRPTGVTDGVRGELLFRQARWHATLLHPFSFRLLISKVLLVLTRHTSQYKGVNQEFCAVRIGAGGTTISTSPVATS